MRTFVSGFLAPPHSALIFIILANLIEFILCVHAAGTPSLPTDVLLANGALTSATLPTYSYLQLLAYGFLHANPTHLLMNMVSLIILGPHLERRVGASYFLLIYMSSLVGAAIASSFVHKGPFVTVGASGAIFGILAALFALWVLGKSELPASFFLINFALNFAFSIRTPGIDWAAHIGGFIVGIAAIAALDVIEKINAFWLRCQFPEFAKFNSLFLVGVMGIALYSKFPKTFNGSDLRLIAVSWFLTSIFLIKFIDMLLSIKNGLAWVVIVLVIGDVVSVCFLSDVFTPGLNSARSRPWTRGIPAGDYLQQMLCDHQAKIPMCVSILFGMLVLLILSPHLVRGLKDTGFVAPTFLAERRRREGI